MTKGLLLYPTTSPMTSRIATLTFIWAPWARRWLRNSYRHLPCRPPRRTQPNRQLTATATSLIWNTQTRSSTPNTTTTTPLRTTRLTPTPLPLIKLEMKFSYLSLLPSLFNEIVAIHYIRIDDTINTITNKDMETKLTLRWFLSNYSKQRTTRKTKASNWNINFVMRKIHSSAI